MRLINKHTFSKVWGDFSFQRFMFINKYIALFKGLGWPASQAKGRAVVVVGTATAVGFEPTPLRTGA